MPIYEHTYIAHNSVIFGPIPNIFIWGCSGDDYLPFTDAAVARSAKYVETLKLHKKPYVWDFSVNPNLQTEFSQKFSY